MHSCKTLILLLLGMVLSRVAETADDEVDITVLDRHIDTLMNEKLGVQRMQRRIDVLEFTREKFDGPSLVKKLSAKISEKIIHHVEGLRKTKHILRDEINSGKYKKSSRSMWKSCCLYPDDKTIFDKSFKTKVDTSNVCELVSDSTPFEYYHLPSTVLDQMRKNHEDMPSLKWQYAGSNEGVFSSYPAHRKPELCIGTHYDPRHRPWYVETARPARKNVLILLDSSNSMARTHNSKRLIDVAIDAVGTLLDSFTPNDKVGIIAFNDTAFYPNDCFSKQLGYADTVNKRKLKEQFLSKLQPAGQSHYAEAFEAAFKILDGSKRSKVLQEARPTLRNKRHCVILFISDGDASEIHHGKVENIYKVIKEGNRRLRNRVKIFTFGLGREANLTLLEKLALQDFADYGGQNSEEISGSEVDRNISQGRAYRINEPSKLRNALSFFYTNLLENITREEIEPSFSVPYVDTGGLGLIFTAGFPVFGHDEKGDFMAAVVAIDISIADLLGDLIKLKNDDRSYVFVIDGSGRVLIHPLMPVPDGSNSLSFIHIEALERDQSLKVVIKSMIEGKQGSQSVLSSRVAPAGDCNQVFVVNQTYHWHPIANTNFSLCFVEEETDYIVSLPPHLAIYGCKDDDGLPVVAHQCANATGPNFRYHRLDLTDSTNVCRHFYQMSTVESSVVKLAPQCFVDSASYEQESETMEMVKNYEELFNALLRVSTSEEAVDLLSTRTGTQSPRNEIRLDVISDIVWTAFSDSMWIGNFDNHVVRRFIGTRTGMVRFYPGTNISASYDPIKRDWYELALAFPGRRVFSPPYKDAAGAGNVITISQTVHTPQIEPNDDNQGVSKQKIIGVMGLDLSLTSFYARLIGHYPQCNSKWHCFIVDIRGYVVLHKDYTEVDKPERKHVTGEEGPLSQILLQRGLMYRARCLELQTTKYKVSYFLSDGAYLNELNNSDRCKRYYMEAIPNTNVFLIGREFHSPCYYETCLINNKRCHEHEECVHHDDWSNATCECPCRADLAINSCDSFIDAQIDIVACYPFREAGEAVKNDCIPEGLQPCYDPLCEEMKTHFNCSSVVGCSWCRKSITGRALENPYCAETDLCYDGFKGQKLPGFAAEMKICELQQYQAINVEVLSIATVTGGLVLLVAILAIYICHAKRKRHAENLKSSLHELSKRSRCLSNMDQEVATIAAAIGAREQLSRRQANAAYASGPIGCQEARRSCSSASSMSSTRQKSAISPQVVLSIVDGDGEEIARSLPRPVQIVRGSRSSNTSDGKTTRGKDVQQLQSGSTASIVIGSAGGSTDLTPAKDSVTRQKISGPQDRSQENKSNDSRCSEDPCEVFSSMSSSPNEDVPEPRRGTRCDWMENGDEKLTRKEDFRANSRSIAYLLKSVLRKKEKSKNSQTSYTGIQIGPLDIEPNTCFYDMFAEPTSNEGDIPIIQSDHSDAESLSHTNSVRDYVSIGSEPGHISWSSRSATLPRCRGEHCHGVEGGVRDDGKDTTKSARCDTGVAPKIVNPREEAGKDSPIFPSPVLRLEARGDKQNPDNANDKESPDDAASHCSNVVDANFSLKLRHRHRRRSCDRSERLKNLNTDNFIVYV